MADSKISALPSATTPLTGVEVVPVVQTGATVKVSIDNLTIGKVVPTNGIQFPATQVASANANTLDDYEEGTFTPYFSCDGGNPTITYTVQDGRYTKIGRQVFVQIGLVINTVSGGSGALRVSGLPFIASGLTSGLSNGFVYNFLVNPQQYYIGNGTDSVLLYTSTFTNTTATNASLQNGAYLYISGSYTTT